MTTSPNHYTRWKIEPIEFIRANNLDFKRGNVIKYLMRYDAKDRIKDLDKALQYLEWIREDWLNRPTGITPIETPFMKSVSGGTAKAGPWGMQVAYPIVDNELIAAERALYDRERDPQVSPFVTGTYAP